MSTWGHVILLYWNRWPRVLKENDRWRLEYWNKPGCHKSLDGLVMVLPWFRWWPAEVIPAFVAGAPKCGCTLRARLAKADELAEAVEGYGNDADPGAIRVVRSALYAYRKSNPEDCGCTKTHECEGYRA